MTLINLCTGFELITLTYSVTFLLNGRIKLLIRIIFKSNMFLFVIITWEGNGDVGKGITKIFILNGLSETLSTG